MKILLLTLISTCGSWWAYPWAFLWGTPLATTTYTSFAAEQLDSIQDDNLHTRWWLQRYSVLEQLSRIRWYMDYSRGPAAIELGSIEVLQEPSRTLLRVEFFLLPESWWGHHTDFSSHLPVSSQPYCIDPPLVLVLSCAWLCLFWFHWTTV